MTNVEGIGIVERLCGTGMLVKRPADTDALHLASESSTLTAAITGVTVR